MRPTVPALLLGCLALPSCLELEATITIAADGSGTQKVVFGMSEALLGRLRRSVAIADASLRVHDPDHLFDREHVREELDELGIELVGHRVFEQRRRRFVEIEAKFAEIDQLRRSPLGGVRAEWKFVRGERPGTAHVIFYPQGREAWLRGRKQAAELRGKPLDASMRGVFEKRRAELAGLDVAVTLQLPGKVIAQSKNLERAAADRVVAKIRGADIKSPADLVGALAPRYEIVIDASACTFDIAER